MIKSKSLFAFLFLFCFVSGVIGGIAGISIVASSPTLQKSVGISTDGGTLQSIGQNNISNITVKEDSAVISSVKKIMPSVVSVIYTKDVEVIDPFGFGYPFGSGGSTQQQQGGGTGFIITADGLVATNKHVIDVEGAKYTVITQDGKKYDAQVMAKDTANDFAILKIEAKNLPVVEFGDSDELEIGQRVIAIGNALGEFQNSVTVGVLSGTERSLVASDAYGRNVETLEGLLQTDAAINEGNSGGPLLNIKGQVVGINTATAAKGQSEGIGFAIPITTLKSAIDSIKKTGKIIRPYIGIRYVAVDQKIAAIKGIDTTKGVIVMGDDSSGLPAVVPGSPAEKAGIKQGDVILKINNDELGEGKSLSRFLNQYSPGNEVTLTIIRDSKEISVKVTLGEFSS
ncbi:MAG: putative serine protease HtrA [candidate division WS2 bacterium ADurb.Bin280]|uniref:Putative serine protease HtrA n=1 Tax=candidate division WS2 bacterium ADurb.Bin280 TaxID=1852829 RepID=A0A1V5SC44_9BACT|nr:MAG: putative serine protease HtrA [candidate division WS2 bacterium ADurb.Bin280]